MEEPKHILVDARPLVDPNAGGVRRVAEQVLRALIASDVHADFTFVTTGMRERTLPPLFANHPSVTHVHLKWPNKLLSALLTFGITSLDRLALRACGDAIGMKDEGGGMRPPSPIPHPPSFFSGALLLNLGFVGFMEIPYALVLHDLSFLIHPRWFSWKGRLWHIAVNPREIARRADRLFAVSETTAQDAERLLKVPHEKLEVFHPGIPKFGDAGVRECGSAAPANPHASTPAHPYVLAFGEQDPRKNVKTAIAAVEQIRKEPGFENLSLVIIGSPRTTHHAPLANWIIRKSSISDQELHALYENASALLYPSWYEGFGLPLHEAARFGLPCLASAHGALPETAPQGTVFAPPGKPHLWAGMLRDMLKNKAAYSTIPDNRYDETDISGFVRWMQQIQKK